MKTIILREIKLVIMAIIIVHAVMWVADKCHDVNKTPLVEAVFSEEREVV